MTDELRKRIEEFIIHYENADLENMSTVDVFLETAINLLEETVNQK